MNKVQMARQMKESPSRVSAVRAVPCRPCEEKKRRIQIERELREIAAASAEIVKED
jgi:hypothetical protein